jgi:hypothetical protein
MKRTLPIAIVVAALTAACSGSSPTSPSPSTPTPSPAPPPVAQFGPGTHRVGPDIAAGRWFSVPSSGCYWERVTGFGGTLCEIIANDFVAYNAQQYIVDILTSDAGFKTDAQCGTWFETPRRPAQTNIGPGVWLIGDQVQPGTYRANASAGCYWERLRNFEHRIASIIANEFMGSGGTALVTLAGGDAGFHTDGDCGTWTRSEALTPTAVTDAPMSRAAIEANRAMNRH